MCVCTRVCLCTCVSLSVHVRLFSCSSVVPRGWLNHFLLGPRSVSLCLCQHVSAATLFCLIPLWGDFLNTLLWKCWVMFETWQVPAVHLCCSSSEREALKLKGASAEPKPALPDGQNQRYQSSFRNIWNRTMQTAEHLRRSADWGVERNTCTGFEVDRTTSQWLLIFKLRQNPDWYKACWVFY